VPAESYSGDKGFAGHDFEAFITDQLSAYFVRSKPTADAPRRPVRPRRPTTTRPDDRRDLAQLDHRRPDQAIIHRLRPLTDLHASVS
jgi:hypothetical protein